MDIGTKISIGVTIVLIGIPTAAGFYPPLFAGYAEQLPIELILTWMERIGLIALGGLIGWFARGQRETETTSNSNSDQSVSDGGTSPDSTTVVSEDTVETIEGCIEVGGALWRGTAKISDGQIKEIEVPYKPLCPRCQTIIYDHEKESVPVATTATTYWDCPSCGYQTEESINKYDNAQKIFETKFEQIVESEGEEYSLENLVESTPEEIWEEYAEIVSDQQVSTDCFH